MPKLEWNKTGMKLYETGVEKPVLFVLGASGYGKGVAWEGLTKFTESPSGAEETKLYANDTKYGSLISNEDFGFTLEAYTYPEEFEACNGAAQYGGPGVYIGQQTRANFGFACVTPIGNDTEGVSHGYKIHLIYSASAKPSSKDHNTISDSPEAGTMSWECSTTPISVPDQKPTSHIVIDSTKAPAAFVTALEALIFGSDSADAKLPLPEEIKTLYDSNK